MNKLKQITWDDLSISQVNRIVAIGNFKGTEVNKTLLILEVLYDKEKKWLEESISAEQLYAYMQVVSNLFSEPPTINFDQFATYKIWNVDWELCSGPKQMTAGQFISFNTILEEQPNNIGLLLAMVLKPKGGTFGELPNGKSYDPGDLAAHLDKTFPFTKARAIANFFWQASLTSRMLTLRSSRKQLTTQARKEKDRAKREIIKQSIAKIDETMPTLKRIAKDAL